MFLLLSKSCAVQSEKIIGIFDIDKTTVRGDTRRFLNTAEKNSEVLAVNEYDIPLTFVVCSGDKIRGKNAKPQLKDRFFKKSFLNYNFSDIDVEENVKGVTENENSEDFNSAEQNVIEKSIKKSENLENKEKGKNKTAIKNKKICQEVYLSGVSAVTLAKRLIGR